ncbi:MAG TPA: energy coupling factor transporter S component ThiW [Clostridiales bacterium]|nr:energy coupling factor transporter S component ThiW [Clostridiales bacterium]
MSVRKLSLAGVLVAVGVVCSTFYIPIGVSKVFPVQHFINIMAGILLGPVYAVGMAFATSLLRNLLGTGSLLAFPGSMCGALLCGLLYQFTKRVEFAFLGEVVGTGILGALIAYPIAAVFLSSTIAFYGFILPFGLSTMVGSALAVAFFTILKRTGIVRSWLGGQEAGR